MTNTLIGYDGSYRSADILARLEVHLAALTILPYDEWSARYIGQIKAQLEPAGEVISDLDLQIASIALHQNATLVTHIQKHFSRLTSLATLVPKTGSFEDQSCLRWHTS